MKTEEYYYGAVNIRWNSLLYGTIATSEENAMHKLKKLFHWEQRPIELEKEFRIAKIKIVEWEGEDYV